MKAIRSYSKLCMYLFGRDETWGPARTCHALYSRSNHGKRDDTNSAYIIYYSDDRAVRVKRTHFADVWLRFNPIRFYVGAA